MKNQNLATAYSVQRKSKRKKMKDGGGVESGSSDAAGKSGPKFTGDNAMAEGASQFGQALVKGGKKLMGEPSEGAAPKMGPGLAKGGAVEDDMDEKMDLEDNVNRMVENRPWEGSKLQQKVNTMTNSMPGEEDAEKFAHGGKVCGHCHGKGHMEEEMEEYEDDMEEPKHKSLAEAIISKMKFKKLAEGGEVDGEFSNEEGPGMRRKTNIDAKEFDTDEEGYDGQPEDSNEHGDDLSDADAHDMVSMIRKKLKSLRK